MSRLKFLISLLICLLLNSELSLSQNLVTNGSFENISQCPDNAGQINYAIGWSNPSSWGTPDLLNSCSDIMAIPSYCYCPYSFQFPFEGDSYVGIYTFGADVPDAREYISTMLNSQLSQGECYLVSYYVSLLNGANFATNNIDVLFTPSLISTNSSIINANPSVSFSKIITDTLNWIPLKAIYQANGTESYLTIGNFKIDSSTDTIKVNNTPINASYYLIDDVSVISISDLGGMPANAGADVGLEIGDSVFIGQEISNLNCTWSILGGAQIADSISGIWVQPTQTTSYVVEQNLCGTITYDTVTVFVHGVGLSEWERESDISVFPNPNKGSFEVDLSNIKTKVQELVILDASGRMVYHEKEIVGSRKITIQTTLEKGIYLLRIQTDLGVLEQKVVIE